MSTERPASLTTPPTGYAAWLAELKARIHAAQQRAAQEAMVGREVSVLFEKAGRMPGQMTGKSDYLHAVHVSAGGVAPGDLARVRITQSGPNSLAGVLAT